MTRRPRDPERHVALLMATGVTSNAAFEVLRKASQRQNRKLQQIAADVVAEAERRASNAGSSPSAH